MAHVMSANSHTPGDAGRPPRGILKNATHPSDAHAQASSATVSGEGATTGNVPTSPDPRLSDKDLTLQNTLQNAGRRRSSSSATRAAMIRRRSSNSAGPSRGSMSDEAAGNADERLRWDEANLYLNEQEKTSTMKIDEPKTPYARRYDPAEDEDEMLRVEQQDLEAAADGVQLDAQELMVDELDAGSNAARERRTREADIPGLELGEPEEALPDGTGGPTLHRTNSGRGEKQVSVDPASEGDGGHGEDAIGDQTREEREKHRRFEEMRRQHYTMRQVKGLLGHPESVDAMDEDDDDDEDNNHHAHSSSHAPALPVRSVPMVNGTS